MSSFCDKVDQELAAIETSWQKFLSHKWHYLITLPGLLILLYVSYFIFCYSTTAYNVDASGGFRSVAAKNAFITIFAIIGFLGAGLLVYKIVRKTFSGRDLGRYGMIMGALALLCFGYYHTWNSDAYSHDYGYCGTGSHWYMIHSIYSSWTFPPVELYNQTYQPRLWHTSMAVFMRFNALFVHPSDVILFTKNGFSISVNEYVLLDMCRIAMAYCGILVVIMVPRIYAYLGLTGLYRGIATFLTCLVPSTWYILYYRNNDGLAFFFEVSALYFALLYYHKRDYVSVLLCAVAIGLGMETKLNAGLISLYVGGLFIYLFVRLLIDNKKHPERLKPHAIRTFLIQMVGFAIVVFPLGLGWAVYANKTYGESIGYVMDLGHSKEATGMFIDGSYYNPFLRYVAFPSPDLFFSIFNHRWMSEVNGVRVNHWGDLDFNCWTAYYKTALFGEYDLSETLTPLGATFSYLTYYLFIFIIMMTMVYSLVKFILLFRNRCAGFKGNHFLRYSVIVLLVINGGAYAYFCYAYPVGCTQNARYALPLIFPMIALMSYALIDVPRFLGHLGEKKTVTPEASHSLKSNSKIS